MTRVKKWPHFMSLSLKEEEVDALRKKSEKHVAAAMKEFECYQGAQYWRLFDSKHGIGTYRKCSGEGEVLGKMSFLATLQEVVELYDAYHVEEYAKTTHSIWPEWVQSITVHSVVPRSKSTRGAKVCVRWMVLKMPGMLIQDRDFCCLETVRWGHDRHGNSVLVHVLESIEIPECPVLEKTMGFVRGKLFSVFIYRQDPVKYNWMHVYHFEHLQPKGRYPDKWITNYTSKRMYATLYQFRAVVEQRRLRLSLFVTRSQWVPNEMRSACYLCEKKFNKLRHRHHCRVCGDIVCGMCHIVRRVDMPTIRKQRVRVCVACTASMTHKVLLLDASDTSSQCTHISTATWPSLQPGK